MLEFPTIYPIINRCVKPESLTYTQVLFIKATLNRKGSMSEAILDCRLKKTNNQ